MQASTSCLASFTMGRAWAPLAVSGRVTVISQLVPRDVPLHRLEPEGFVIQCARGRRFHLYAKPGRDRPLETS